MVVADIAGSAMTVTGPGGVARTTVTTESSVMSSTISNDMSEANDIYLYWANGTVKPFCKAQRRLSPLPLHRLPRPQPRPIPTMIVFDVGLRID
jgi:hypothetical protein